MKIKCGFVTNSSSTSFIIKSTLSGYLYRNFLGISVEEILDEIKIECAKLGYQNLIVKNNTLSNIVSPEKRYEVDFSKFKIYLTNTLLYDDKSNNDLGEIIVFLIVVESRVLVEQNSADNKNLSFELLKQICHICESNQVEHTFYSQYPDHEELDSEGWDTGNPMGSYAYTYQLFENEVKSGIVKKVGDGNFLLRNPTRSKK